MPVILQDVYCERWLGNEDPHSEVFTWALEHPSKDPLKIYPVSNLLNDPKNDDPHCIEPAQIDRGLGGRNGGKTIKKKRPDTITAFPNKVENN